MTNTHADLVNEVRNFAEKSEFVNDFKYVKDVTKLAEELSNLKPRALVLSLDTLVPNDQDYNYLFTYAFTFTDVTLYDTDSVVMTESINAFCMMTLNQYLNQVVDANVNFEGISFATETDGDNAYCSVTGTFTFNMKINPLAWSKLYTYD